MVCPNCGKELSDDATTCSNCGAAVSTYLSDEPPPPPTPRGVPPLSTTPPLAPLPKFVETTRDLRRSDAWRPRKDRVQEWIENGGWNHYAVLELPMDAPDSELRLRVAALGQTLEYWANDIDKDLQRLGGEGKRVYQQLIADLNDRPAYDRELVRRHRELKLSQFVDNFVQFTRGSSTLSPKAVWELLIENADKYGLSKDELNQAVEQLKQRGVLTAIDIAGHRVRTLAELKVICGDRAEPLVGVFNNGVLELWLRHIANEPEQVEMVRFLRAQNQGAPLVGARKWLQLIADDAGPGDSKLPAAGAQERIVTPPSPGKEASEKVVSLPRDPTIVTPLVKAPSPKPAGRVVDPEVKKPRIAQESPPKPKLWGQPVWLWVVIATATVVVLGFGFYFMWQLRPPEFVHIPLHPSEVVFRNEVKAFQNELPDRICAMVREASVDGQLSEADRRHIVNQVLLEKRSLESISKKVGGNIPVEVTEPRIATLINQCSR